MSNSLSSRRDFLAGLAGLSAAVVVAPGFAAQRATSYKRKGLIDVHHHIGPPPNSGGRRGEGGGEGVGWTAAKAVEEMDKNGVATGVGYLGPVNTPKQARDYNEFGAQLVKDYPGRFGLFAALAMSDVDATLKEIAYALDTLKADGFGITTQYGPQWLGDPKFRPIWEELHRRKSVVYVHPSDAPCCNPMTLTYETPASGSAPAISGPWLEWPMNTARTMLSLMLNKVTIELPGVRFIFSHGGGVMPLLVDRIAGFDEWPAVGPERLKAVFPNGIRAEFSKFYFEGAQAYSPVNMQALLKLVPSTHVLFGTDYDRFPISHSVRLFGALQLDPKTRRGIERENAEALLPALRSTFLR